MKPTTACKQCRTAKRKCRVVDKESGCSACRLRGQQCSAAGSEEQWQTALSPTPIPGLNVTVLSRDIGAQLPYQYRVELVDHYFTFIHDRPQILFHEPTLKDQVRTGDIDEALLFAICSLGCRFSRDSALKCLESSLSKASKRLLHANFEKISLQTIQTCILLANLSAANLDIDCEALYFGMAVRMAQIIKLPLDNRFDNPVLRETKRRVWWTLFMADRWCSSRSGLPLQIRDFDYEIDLPIDEYEFKTPDFNEYISRGVAKPGLWAYKIKLVKVFTAIQDLNRSIAEQTVTQVEMDAQVNRLAQLLTDWEKDLPAEMRMSEQRIEEYRLKGLGGAFIDLHLGFHHYSALLFFSYLDDRHRLDPSVSHYPQLCKSHALRFSELLRFSRGDGRCEVVHAPVAHMTIISSAVLIHMLLFGGEQQSTMARNSLLSNFETLLELKRFWPSSERLISRLCVFQDACLASMDANTHKVDGWMARFLLEYAPQLDDETSDGSRSYTTSHRRRLQYASTSNMRYKNDILAEILERVC